MIQHCSRAGAPLDSLINIQPEEDEDDLIYECPGLAPHGEMEVTNPFFLGKDFNMNLRSLRNINLQFHFWFVLLLLFLVMILLVLVLVRLLALGKFLLLYPLPHLI